MAIKPMVQVNVKAKLSLCFFFKLSTTPWRCIGEWRYISTHSFTSVLDGGKWSVSRSGRFTPRERTPGTHWIEGWEGPRAVLDAVVKRKIRSPRWEPNPRTLIVQPVVQRYTDWTITAFDQINGCIRGLDASGSALGPVAGGCEYGNEP
jgi:hypothetical protein